MKIYPSATARHDAPVVSGLIGAGVVLAIPMTLYVLFSVWSDSIQRQVIGIIGLAALVVFSVVRKKFEALLLSLVFFSQFSISLHSIPLAPPAIFQFYFIDIVIVLFVMTGIERREQWRPDTIGWLFLLLFVWQSVATVFSAHIDRSLLFLMWHLKFVTIYLVLRNAYLSPEFVSRLRMIVILVLLIQGAIAVAQQIKGGPLGLNVFGEQDASRLFFVNGGLRVSGTLGVTIGFGGYLAAMICFLTPYALTRRNALVYVGLTVGMVALLLTLSRAAWLAMLVGSSTGVIVLARSKILSWSKTLVLGLCALLLLALAVAAYYEKVVERFQNKEAVASAAGRFYQVFQAWPVITEYPLVGIGPGVTEYYGAWNENQKYVRKNLPNVRFGNQMHSAELQYWVESGTPGFMLFLAIICVTTFSAYRSQPRGIVREDVAVMRIGAGSAALSLLVHASFGTEINNYQIFLCFWILLALARNGTLHSLKVSERKETPGIPAKPGNFV